ncbi:MAG: alpha/beta hydrolase [Proteobacteria bacterium]|uniref:Alpha/beta hydrolase n=1 Tax=Candidatus Avisuccinivibrio stercorigallinarum TaxID=2840704 RepID=A0A9D9D930_9GAMM|nr:alpha/beta hydrolase [Candidatus Avisuccinivibrio stercorigallinarum]
MQNAESRLPGSAQSTAEDTAAHSFFSAQTTLTEVINDPAFAGFGRLLFPLQPRFVTGSTLGDLTFTFYYPCVPEDTIAVLDNLKGRALAGEQIFFPLYSGAEIKAEPDKAGTGLFFFKGRPNAPQALICAGGAFAFVGAMQDSFPHALELSKRGINAWVLIYRPGQEHALADAARAVDVMLQQQSKNAGSSEPPNLHYSVWGGSAGARLAALIGRFSPLAFGGQTALKPDAVIMQYTGFDSAKAIDVPAFAVVGTDDYIAPWLTVLGRTQQLQKLGIKADIRIFRALGHGFGIGRHTTAEGWLDDALKFWFHLLQPQTQAKAKRRRAAAD